MTTAALRSRTQPQQSTPSIGNTAVRWSASALDAAARRICRRQNQLHANSARGGFLVNWKTDLKSPTSKRRTAIEIMCKRCGYTRYGRKANSWSRAD